MSNSIDELINIGFKPQFKEQEIINSPYPFAVDLDNKIVAHLTTPSYSAAALMNDAILDDDEFIKQIDEYIKKI